MENSKEFHNRQFAIIREIKQGVATSHLLYFSLFLSSPLECLSPTKNKRMPGDNLDLQERLPFLPADKKSMQKTPNSVYFSEKVFGFRLLISYFI